MVTPALIVIGLPAHLAVGTSLIWVFGNSVVGAFRHNRLGNVDFKMGILLTVASMFGVELGVRLLNVVKDIGIDDTVVLVISICLLIIIGVYALCESLKKKKELDSGANNEKEISSDTAPYSLARKVQGIKLPPMLHFNVSKLTISLWVILLTGFFYRCSFGLNWSGRWDCDGPISNLYYRAIAVSCGGHIIISGYLHSAIRFFQVFINGGCNHFCGCHHGYSVEHWCTVWSFSNPLCPGHILKNGAGYHCTFLCPWCSAETICHSPAE